MRKSGTAIGDSFYIEETGPWDTRRTIFGGGVARVSRQMEGTVADHDAWLTEMFG
jgi:hypothetical protein